MKETNGQDFSAEVAAEQNASLRLFPVNEKLTRESFDLWFANVYPIALRGVFRSKPETFARAKTRGRVSDKALIFNRKDRSIHEAQHDALTWALELVYEMPLPDNPILGREYNSVEHLAHRFRKVADGCVRGGRRAEAPDPPTSAKGITSKIEAAIPDFSEAEPPVARFHAKYLVYETASCPWCASEANRALDLLAGITPNRHVPLKTRQCASCGVAVPEGVDVRLVDPDESSPNRKRDEADSYQRVWERAAAPVLRRAAAEGRLFETLVDEHPYSAMMPLRIQAPRTSAMEAAWRADAATVRRRIAKSNSEPDQDRRAAAQTNAVMYAEDAGHYATRVASAMRLDPHDTYAAAPPSRIWTKRSAAHRPVELNEIESLSYRVKRWRREVQDLAHRIGFVDSLLAERQIPSGMRRRRPDRTLPEWPTPPIPAAKLPTAVQAYRLQAMLIGQHLLGSLDIVVAEVERAGQIPVVTMPGWESDAFSTAASAGKQWLRQPPERGSTYDDRRRIEHIAALTYAYRHAAYSLDLEAFLSEIRQRYAFTW